MADFAGVTNPELHRLRAEALAAGRRAEAGAIAEEIAARTRRHLTGELLDVYDDSLRPVGVKDRGLVHLDGDWHRSFHCWLCSPARRTLLVQRRGRSKTTYPGALDTTVAGHYRAGEGLAEVCREGEEEMGVVLRPEALLPLGRAVTAARHGVLIDREVADVFLHLTDVAFEALRPDPLEVDEVLELAVDDAVALFRGETADVPAVARAACAEGAGRPARVRAEEFTAHQDRYYARVALQARRAADGLPILYV